METVVKSFQTSRGALLLISSQLVAILAGFAIHVGLTRFLSPELYGLYAVTISVLMWGELLISGSIGMMFPKVLSEGSVSPTTIWRWVWRIYLPLWVALWLGFSVASWGIAVWMRDERLMLLLLIAALELPFFGVYFSGRSLLQGLMAYGWQATVSSIWALLRLICVFAFVIVTKSVFGAIAGNSLAVALTALIAVAFVRPFLKGLETQTQVSPLSLITGIGLPVLAITLLDQITLAMDLWILKRLGQPEHAGFYGAARFFAFVPLMLSIGLYSAWFTGMCYELGRGERERAKSLMREAMRVLILGLLPFATVVWVTAKPLSVLLFSSSFEPTSEPMKWLVVAVSLFTFMGFMRGALIADNEMKLPIAVAVAVTALDFALCYLLIPRYEMLGAAWATTIASGFGLILMWVLAGLRFGDFMPWESLVRVGVACFALWLFVSFWSVSGLMLLVQYLLVGVLYILLLVFLGELKSSDWHVLRAVLAGIAKDATRAIKKV